MARFPVNQSKEKALAEAMDRLGICEEDLRESFSSSAGSGGQSVNRTASAVSLTHLPTGLRVRCQTERSRGLNRYWARKRLVEKMEEKLHPGQSKKALKSAKIKRQKARRKRRSSSTPNSEKAE